MSIVENAISKVKQDGRGPDKPAPEIVTTRRGPNLAELLAARPPLVLPVEKLRQDGIMPPALDERRMMAE